MTRLPAKDPQQRRGTVVVNLGGPMSSTKALAQAPEDLAELTTWFDVVAFDPRGIGASGGVTCSPAPTQTSLLTDTSLREWGSYSRTNAAWAQACMQQAGPLAEHLDSWQVAHDLDAVRDALGEKRLRYLGNSYGTVYGQSYAELFPTKVDKMLLDSVADHTDPDPFSRTAPMARMQGERFDQFAAWCATATECAIEGDPRRAWDLLVRRAQEQPLPADEGPAVTADQVRFATLSLLDKPARWATLSKAIVDAEAGNAGALAIRPVPDSDDTMSRLAFCADHPFTGSPGQVGQLERRLQRIDPRVGWLSARTWYGRCAGLPQQGSNPPHPIDATGLPPVLIMSGLEDDTTPPELGTRVAAHLPGSVQLTADSGHAVYVSGNRCARDRAHAYLINGTVPEPGTHCGR